MLNLIKTKVVGRDPCGPDIAILDGHSKPPFDKLRVTLGNAFIVGGRPPGLPLGRGGHSSGRRGPSIRSRAGVCRPQECEVQAIVRACALKPAIPRVGNYGIPVRDEVEFEMWLK